MTDLMDRAVKSVKALPPETQDELARMMLLAAGEEVEPGEVYKLTEEDKAAIAESRAQAARGEFATDEQLQAHRAKFRL